VLDAGPQIVEPLCFCAFVLGINDKLAPFACFFIGKWGVFIGKMTFLGVFRGKNGVFRGKNGIFGSF
jgi:hypothetical protein